MREDFVKTVKEAYLVKKQIDALEQRYNDLLDSLGSLDSKNYPAGEYILQVRPTLRFDAATAKRALTPAEFESILVSKPDSTVAKKVLGEDRFKVTQKVYGQTRTIVPVTDEE